MRRFVLGFALGLVIAVGGMRVFGADGAPVLPKPGDVISGQDFGFRFLSLEEESAVGYFVIRVNGQWKRTATKEIPGPRVMPAH
jgi:hypothetical protein